MTFALVLSAVTMTLPVSVFAASNVDADELEAKLSSTVNPKQRQEVYNEISSLWYNKAEEVPERIKALNEANANGLKQEAAMSAANICRNYYKRNMLDSMTVWGKRVEASKNDAPSAYFYAKYYETRALLDRGCCFTAKRAAQEMRDYAAKTNSALGEILSTDLLGSLSDKLYDYPVAAIFYNDALSKLTDDTKIDAEIVKNLFAKQVKAYVRADKYNEAIATADRFSSLAKQGKLAKYYGPQDATASCDWDINKLYLYCYASAGDKTMSAKYYENMLVDSERDEYKDDSEYNYLRAMYLMLNEDYETAIEEIDYVLVRVDRVEPEHLMLKYRLEKLNGNDQEATLAYKAACDTISNSKLRYLSSDVRMLSSGDTPNLSSFIPQEEFVAKSNILTKYLDAIIIVALVLLIISIVFYILHRIMHKKLTRANETLTEEKEKLKAVTADLQTAYDEVEKSNVKRNEFLETLSYGMRTPLNSIVGFSEMILEGQTDANDLEKEYANIIIMNSDLMLKLVNDILDLSQLNSSGLDVDIAEVDVCKVALDVSNAIKPLVKPDVAVNYTSNVGSAKIYTDRYRLQQLLNNLLSNAAKFTESGEINVDVRQNKSSIVFTVTDTGCGVSEEDKKRLFQRYEKLNEAANGTGLGLYISMLISKKLGGKIYLDESYTGGSKFVFEHPTRLQFGQTLIEDSDDNSGEAATK